MDQLHEELKEPAVAAVAALTEARDSDSSDTDEKREGDRSPSEDEFLSCDSSSDRGEGDGQGRGGSSSPAETELLIPEEAGRAISEKERMKDRKFSWGQQRTNSEQVDEDADVDTAMAVLDQPSEAQPPSPRSTSPCQTPGISQPGSAGLLGESQSCGHLPCAKHQHAADPSVVDPTTRSTSQVRGSLGQAHGLTNPKPHARFCPSPRPQLEWTPTFQYVGWAQDRGDTMNSGLCPIGRCWQVLFLLRPWSWHGRPLLSCPGSILSSLCPQSQTTMLISAAPLAPAALSTTMRAMSSCPAALLVQAL
jgi:hypothetical protein